MKPILLFSEYCAIEHELEKSGAEVSGFHGKSGAKKGKAFGWDINMLQTKAMFIANPDNTDVVTLWLEQCNLQMVEQLIDYFEKDAPIQDLLFKRYEILKKESAVSVDEIEIVEQNKKFTTYDFLIEQMENKGYKTDAEFYRYIGMDRRNFAKLRKNDACVTRENALWLAVGLELNYLETQVFLKNLGYALRKNVRRENIISQVMRTRKYKFSDMQEVLYYFGEKTFGE